MSDNDTPAAAENARVPAYSWYALSVLVLIYILNFVCSSGVPPITSRLCYNNYATWHAFTEVCGDVCTYVWLCVKLRSA